MCHAAYCLINNRANSLLLSYVHYLTTMPTTSTTNNFFTWSNFFTHYLDVFFLHSWGNFFSSFCFHYWRLSRRSSHSCHPTASSGDHHSCSVSAEEESSSSEIQAPCMVCGRVTVSVILTTMYTYTLFPSFHIWNPHTPSGINHQDPSSIESGNTQLQIKRFLKNDDTTKVGENPSVRNPYSEATDQL